MQKQNRQQALLPIHSKHLHCPAEFAEKTESKELLQFGNSALSSAAAYMAYCVSGWTHKAHIQPIRANAAQRFSGGLRRWQSSELGHLQRTTYSFCCVAQLWILLHTLRFCLIPAARTKGSRVIKVKQKNVPSQCA